MSSSRTITLFSERSVTNQRPSSFLFSIVAHAAGITLLSFGIIYAPEINDRSVTRRYTVRHLDMHTPTEKPRQSGSQGIVYPGPHSDERRPVPGQKPASLQAVLRQTANAQKGLQTLVQPDLPDPVKITVVTPVPTVIIWTPETKPVKQVVAPLPEKATAADVKPSVRAPNQEMNLGDIGISSTAKPTQSIAVAPTTTSPLQVKGPDLVQLPPVTASQTAKPPTPTSVMTLSDLRMPDGTATLPPVNETVAQNESGILAPGRSSDGKQSKDTGGANKEQPAGNSGEPIGVVGPDKGEKPGLGVGSGQDQGLSTQQISLPKDGEFGAVIVGANLDEKYPEMSGIWNDRIAYTVYLHVGLSKSWILQYSLPRSSEASQSGNIARLEAPWPFNIVRPNIPPGVFNSDAILVRGFVNQQGRFESLALAFPPDFQQAKFVLDALNQWQFRPAMQNGKTQRVEVLLIIPEELEQGQIQ
jgi:hypothetical protein